MNKEEFIEELKKLNIPINQKKLQQLQQYYQLLVEENKKYNLTAITEEKEVYLKHFYDSLTIAKIITLTDEYICDVGTGAGFPGIVLKIFYPDIKLDLIDATSKKCYFLNLVITKLELKKVNVINERAEEYSQKHREIYDIVTSRAVAPLKHLLEYAIPMLKVDGKFIALKSNIDLEMKNITNYYQKLFLHNEQIIEFELPQEHSKRTIYKIEKLHSTDKKYPRKYFQIKKSEI